MGRTVVLSSGRCVMIRSISLLTILVAVFSVFSCLNPKDKENELDAAAALAVLLSYNDNGNGTVTGPNGLLWMKCAYGQVWDPAWNACTGTGGGTTFGARSVKYCEVEGLCTNTVTLLADSGPAFDACNTITVGGLTGWRLPTKYELGNIGQGMDRPTMLWIFPQTPDDKEFWSSSQDESEANLARAMSFAGLSFGQEYGRQKTDVKYVKCVR